LLIYNLPFAMEDDGYDLKWKDHVQEVFSEVQKLRARDYFSDVIVHCGGRNFRAHKVILAASSTFFERVLTGIPKDRSQVLIMSETQPDLLEKLLNFIYDGETFVPSDILEKFMATAELLGIRGLRQDSSEEASSESRKASKRPMTRVPDRGERGGDTDENGGGDPFMSKRLKPNELQKPLISTASAKEVVMKFVGDKPGAGVSGAARATASGLDVRPAARKVRMVLPCAVVSLLLDVRSCA
jgi:hypothetical protein